MNAEDHRVSRRAYDDVFIRKGSLAAFMVALRRYDSAAPDSDEATRAAADIEALLPAMSALGVFEVLTVKSVRARALLQSLDPRLLL